MSGVGRYSGFLDAFGLSLDMFPKETHLLILDRVVTFLT